MKKRPIRLRRGFAFTLALALLLIGVPLSSAPADSGVQFIRVLLSTQGVSSMNVPVKGTYTLAQTQRYSFSKPPFCTCALSAAAAAFVLA